MTEEKNNNVNVHPITQFELKNKQRNEFINENKTVLPTIFLLNLVLAFLLSFIFTETNLALIYFIYDCFSLFLIIFALKKVNLFTNEKALIWIVPILLFSFTSKLFSIHVLPFQFIVSPLLLGIFLLKSTNSQFHEILDVSLLVRVLQNFIPNFSFNNAALTSVVAEHSLSLKKDSPATTTIKNVLIGLAIAIPFLVIVITLLSASDTNFAHLFESFSIVYWNYSIIDFIFKIIITLILFFTFSFYATKSLSLKKQGPTPIKKANLSPIASATFLICLNAVYIVFLYLQIKYVFLYGPFTLPPGFEYYEFAHAAFFNTFAVTILNIAIILYFTEFTELDFKNNFFKLNFILIFISNMLLIFTALNRMAMYMNEFGFTSLRQAATLGLLFELVVMIFLILRFKNNSNFYKRSIIALLVFLILNNLIANDFVSTHLNFKKFNVTKDILNSTETFHCTYSSCYVRVDNHVLTFPVNDDSRAYLIFISSTKEVNELIYQYPIPFFESITHTLLNTFK